MKKSFLVLIIWSLFQSAFTQSVLWEKVIHDDFGNPLFAGGMSFASPSFVDIDNDGDLDCFSGGKAGRIIFFENTGTPDSAQWRFVTSKYGGIDIPGISKSNVTFVDIDADGDPDMFIGGERSSNDTGIYFYKNDGTPDEPVWVFVSNQYQGIQTNPNTIFNYCKPTFADMDNDGDLDLLFGNYKTDIYYENVGDAQNPDFILTDPDYFDFGALGYWNYNNPVLVDIDDDGDYDCFLGASNTHFVFLENIGTPEEAAWYLVTEEYIDLPGYSDNLVPEFCDIDNDQDLDLYVGFSNGKVLVYSNETQTNVPQWEYRGDNPFTIDIGYNSNICFADIYGNKKPSLFFIETGLDISNNFIIEYQNTGTTFEPTWELKTATFFNIHYTNDWINALYFADIDNDNDLDLFIGLGFSNQIMFHENTGDPFVPQFNEVGVVALEFNDMFNIMFNPVLVDIDADYDLDMYISAQETVMGYDPVIWFYKNTGTPTEPVWEFEYSDNAVWGKLAFMDEDGDGDLDAFYSGYMELFQMHDSIYFYENIGDIHNPAFSLKSLNYLPDPFENFSTIVFYDTDNDNDMDMYLGGDRGGLCFYENQGPAQHIGAEDNTMKKNYFLNCFPVPFSVLSGLEIEYSVSEKADVRISIVNSQLRYIDILSEKNVLPGNYSLHWNDMHLIGFDRPGIYFVRLYIGDKTILKKIIRL